MKKLTLLLIAILIVVVADAARKPKYIFYFIGDGMGHNHVALTEAALAAQKGKIGFEPLNFTLFPAVGFITTNASTRLTTDSAAAGTALASGEKTSPGTIGMDTAHNQDLTSVAVNAKNKGMKVGITSSVSLDHATPASFFAHAQDRNMSYKIASWAAPAGFDLYASSGLLKPTEGENIYEILSKNGYTIARGAGVDLKGDKVYWEQVEGANSANLPLAIDAKNGDLTLAEITRKAISFLDNKKGFFLMVEGGQIDWAAHANDAAAIVHETKDFANAIAEALDFYKRNSNETLIIVTADHETGGMSLGLGERNYDTSLELLFNQKMSVGMLEQAIAKSKSWSEAREILAREMGFWGAVKISAKEELQLLTAYEAKAASVANVAMKMLNTKAGVGFTSGTHTAAYVPIFAIGVGSEIFNGRGDNTDVPKRILTLIEK